MRRSHSVLLLIVALAVLESSVWALESAFHPSSGLSEQTRATNIKIVPSTPNPLVQAQLRVDWGDRGKCTDRACHDNGLNFVLVPRHHPALSEKSVVLFAERDAYIALYDRLWRYVHDVESAFPDTSMIVEVISDHSNGELLDAIDLRERISGYWHSLGDQLQGVIFLGTLPYAMWEFPFGDPCPLPLFYEDLDGDFQDQDGDGQLDFHEWGDVDAPQIWSAYMPGYGDDVATSLADYLDKLHAYYEGDLPFSAVNPRAILYAADVCGGVPNCMEQQYLAMQESFVVERVCGGTSSADYTARLEAEPWAFGYVLGHTTDHSGGHQFDVDNFYSADAVNLSSAGGLLMTLILGCHAGDFADGENRCIAQAYPFGSSMGLASAAAVRTIGIEFEQDFLRDLGRKPAGEAFKGWLDTVYDRSLIHSRFPNDDINRFVWDYILYGDPFVILPASYPSTTTFTDRDGNEVASYSNADDIYVKVIDPSHAGAASLLDAVKIDGQTFDLAPLTGAATDTFITNAISMTDLGVNAGDTITATYTDPTDPTDISSDTISITALYVSCYFTYRLVSVDPVANTFTLSFEGRAYTYPDTVDVTDWRWSFCDGTEDCGQVVTHTFSGLGGVCNVVLEATVGAASSTSTEVIWGLGGLSWALSDALQTGDPSELQQLQRSLSWSGGSIEKIYRACVDASLKVFDLADRYGLTSPNQVSQALSKALEGPVDLRNLQGVSFDALTKPFEEAVKPLQTVLGRLPGLEQLLGNPPLETNSTGQRELVGSITLPQIYQEAEDIATFVDDLLTKFSPVVADSSFELQFPTCAGCNPNLYIGLDNGDIAGILAGIATAKATLEILLAYTPGDLFMNNLEFQFFDDGSVEVQGWDTITNSLWDNFHAARGNGILDLNGSGDGDTALGCEVLPASCLTLRDGQWLQSAKANLAQALAWLRTAIQDMPTSPGPHDPQLEWPLQMMWPWSGETVSVSKADLLNLIDTVDACLQGPTAVDIDIDFDGVTDYSTGIDLSSFFDDPITDLKTLLPDLVVASDPNDPLIILPNSLEGIDRDWKIDGTLNRSTEYVAINFPGPTFGGVLPNGDANSLLTLLIFGHANPACQNEKSQLEAAGWHMITLPGELCAPCEPWGPGEGGDLICALSDDIDPCYIFRYDPTVGGYVMAPPAENIPYHAGMGFWVRTYEDNVSIDVEVQVPTEAVGIPLSDGWNQIGNPFPFAVPVNALKVRCGGTELPLLDAQEQGWVSVYLFGYDTASGGYLMVDPTNGCLQSWSGYWMRSYREGCELVVPPTECSGAALAGELMSVKELQGRGLELPPSPPTDFMSRDIEEVLANLTVRNIPNPIRSEHTTTFKVEGKGAELVQAIRVEIYDQAGQRVFTQDINSKELEWHTVNDAGELLANGVYLYQVWVKIGDTWYPTGVHKLAVVR